MSFRMRLALALSALPLLVARGAQADDTPSEATTAPTPAPATAAAPTSPPAIGSFRAKYIEAREAMLAGHFETCRDAFALLAAEAPSESDRMLASEMADICGTLAKKGLTFIHQKDLGEASLSAKAVGIRTTDELAFLYTSAVLFGVGTGIWIGQATDARGPSVPALAMLGTAAAGTVAVYVADRGKGMPYGVPHAISSGMWIGFEQALAWSFWHEERRGGSRWTDGEQAMFMWGLTAAGALGGGILGATTNVTPGRAAWVGSGALWGGLVAGAVGFSTGSNGRDRESAFALAAALGNVGGVVLGLATAGVVSPSVSRVRFMDLGGLAGGLVAGGLYFAASGRSVEETGLGVTLAAGMVAGLGVAAALSASIPRDDPKEQAKDKGVSWSPTLAPTKGGATLGLSGTF